MGGASVAAVTRSTIPQPGFDALRVYVPRRQRVLVKQGEEFWRTHEIKPYRVFPEELAEGPESFVFHGPSSTARELITAGALDRSGSWPGRCGRTTSRCHQEPRCKSFSPSIRSASPACARRVTLHAYRSTLVLAGLPLSPFGGPVVTSAARLGKSPGVGSKWQARRLARRNHCRPARASLPGQPARASPAAGYCRVAGRSLRTSAEIAAQASCA